MYVRVTTSLPCGTAVDARHVAQCDKLTKIESESVEETSASHVVVKEESRQSGVTTSLVLRGLPQLAFTLPPNDHSIVQYVCVILSHLFKVKIKVTS
jgi:hypothetical protein